MEKEERDSKRETRVRSSREKGKVYRAEEEERERKLRVTRRKVKRCKSV